MENDLDKRIELAKENFKAGFNCSQSIFSAFADMYGIDKETALKLSSSFGGGIGRMRQTCGVACGMFMLAGMEQGTTDPKDHEAKADTYKLVQDLAAAFKEKNGAINCGELLGLTPNSAVSSTPEARTDQYYKKRPCAQIVEEGAKIWADYLKKQQK